MRFNPLLCVAISACFAVPVEAQSSSSREMPEQQFLDAITLFEYVSPAE